MSDYDRVNRILEETGSEQAIIEDLFIILREFTIDQQCSFIRAVLARLEVSPQYLINRSSRAHTQSSHF